MRRPDGCAPIIKNGVRRRKRTRALVGRYRCNACGKTAVWSMAATFSQSDTGLPMIIWVSMKASARRGPRIKVQKNHDAKTQTDEMVSVSVTNTPRAVVGLTNRDLELVTEYIVLNRAVLLDYWNDIISTPALVSGLRKT